MSGEPVHQITSVKVKYGQDLDWYKRLCRENEDVLERLKDALNKEDHYEASKFVEDLEVVEGNKHRIFVRLNEQLCAIYNTLPG